MKDKIFILIIIILATLLVLSWFRPKANPVSRNNQSDVDAIVLPVDELVATPSETAITKISRVTTLLSPAPGVGMRSPVKIKGTMPGSWYFEATAGVTLLDANGVQIGQTYATAEGEWMTDQPVPFTADLEFTVPATPTGTLILKADNPSGLPRYDKEESYSVIFAR